MNVRAKLSRELAELWTTEELVRRFRVSPMTVYTWRQKRRLPHFELPSNKRPAIRFIAAEVIAWAKENGVKMYNR